MTKDIEANAYVRRNGKWKFRVGLGPRDYFMRCFTLFIIFGMAFWFGAKSPKGKEDRKWLIEFSMVMFVWFTAVHAIAYLPTLIFGSFRGLIRALTGQISHAV